MHIGLPRVGWLEEHRSVLPLLHSPPKQVHRIKVVEPQEPAGTGWRRRRCVRVAREGQGAKQRQGDH